MRILTSETNAEFVSSAARDNGGNSPLSRTETHDRIYHGYKMTPYGRLLHVAFDFTQTGLEGWQGKQALGILAQGLGLT